MNAETIKKIQRDLCQLRDHLDRHRDTILDDWRNATLAVPGLTIVASLSRTQFLDHIPRVLDAYSNRLCIWPDKESLNEEHEEKKMVSDHGIQRWQQGYELRELTKEWGHLHMRLMEELESFQAVNPGLEPQVMPIARRELTQLCCDGISDSTTQYWRLHQVEAAAHVRDLQLAIATLSNIDKARAEVWRQAAHDLRGSLGVVKVATALLDPADVASPQHTESFSILQQGVTSLQEMLTDLMSLARLQAGHEQRKVAAFDAGAMLTQFHAKSLQLARERGLYLKVQGPESLPVEGDRIKVERILKNLLLNALKYTERGGVTLIWGPTKDGDLNKWMFCVQDTGPGLSSGAGSSLARQLYNATQTVQDAVEIGDAESPSQHPSAAATPAPTATTQSTSTPPGQQPGEGVGLSIVKRLCELLDASLELETSAGKGSTFRVILPRKYEAK